MKTLRRLAAFTLVAGGAAWAQDRPSFEVASIRPAAGTPPLRGSKWGPGTADPEHYVARNTPLKSLIMAAYKLEQYQFSGPGSTDSRWDVLANATAGATKEQVNLMLQNLLEDRFHLKFHHEMKEFKAYDLVIAKGGLKLKDSIPTDACSSGGHLASGAPCPRMSQQFGIAKAAGSGAGMMISTPSTGMATGRNLDMASLARVLRGELGDTIVIDKAGLTGTYDVRMQFAVADLRRNHPPQDDSSYSYPSVFTALEQQLGLKLQPTKAMVEMTIIDRIDGAPTDN